ncbi:spore coat protein GerQ [Tumebacillus permanentifrigoris]|uniref:Spore germination protein Q n=1 Tax=Tumebacillus permanentifrigoris TaxID=378543 RepID=A0A316DGB0_9BACL|nr:spore coat protein GerQ [Tumebacillus permanentifrigoris]PWK16562.1 spore germination protein Q [Tumebacillus permanentifrigoris]
MYTYSPCSKSSAYPVNHRASSAMPYYPMPVPVTMPIHPGMAYPQMPMQMQPQSQMPTGPQSQIPMGPTTDIPNAIGGPGEESYLENILRFNRGKVATFYLTFENNTQWNAKIVRGRIETAGRDHIIVSDPQTGKRFLLQMINLDWVEFDGPIAYIPPKLPPSIAQDLTTG